MAKNGAERFTFVLVHGSWCGSWAWKPVRDMLQAQGHRVFAPTLSGLADRSHLLSADINLTTHILDVANLIRWEDLTDVVLVGHSYAGQVISGVADRVPPGTIRSIVYFDAFYFGDGERAPIPQDAVHRPQFIDVDGVRCLKPPRSELAFGLPPEMAAFVDGKFTPMPAACFGEIPVVKGARDTVPVKTFVLTEKCTMPFFRPVADALEQRPDWRVERAPYNHLMIIEQPGETVQILLAAARV